MALDSTATAHWEGDLMSGGGTTTLTSGAGGPFPVDWKARSQEHGGKTSPEELIAAVQLLEHNVRLAENPYVNLAQEALDDLSDHATEEMRLSGTAMTLDEAVALASAEQ